MLRVSLCPLSRDGHTLSRHAPQIVTLIKILKIPKLLRLGRVFKFLEKIEGAANVGRIIMLMIMMAVFVHWISCVWFAGARPRPEPAAKAKLSPSPPVDVSPLQTPPAPALQRTPPLRAPHTLLWEVLPARSSRPIGGCSHAPARMEEMERVQETKLKL